MPADLRVVGADKLGDVARRLKETADKDLRRELYRGINRAAKPLKDVAKRSALASLPTAGGLSEWVASSKFSASTRAGQNPAVRFSGRKAGHDLRALDRGRLRHPLFGNRRHWYNQQIHPGWFSRPMEAAVPDVRRDIVNVLDDIARRIAR